MMPSPLASPTIARRRLAAARRAAGFTLIELMVSMAIGLLLIAALTMVLSSSSQNSRSNDRTSELMNNGRYALATLQRDLLHAGLRGYTYPDPNAPTGVTITNDCAAGFVANLRQGVWGTNDSNPFSATCIPAANYARGDVLVVRRTGLDAAAALVAAGIYFSSAYEAGEMFRGTTVPTSMATLTPKVEYPVQTYVYYISPWTTSVSESPKIPALYRVALNSATGVMAPELVASGIEHLQVQYARSTTDLKTRLYNANAVSATATSTTTTITEWDDVNSVRVWLLARNSTAEPGFVNTTSYAMGDVTYTVNDGFRRQLFSTVLQLRK